jgi:hypothetical protein
MTEDSEARLRRIEAEAERERVPGDPGPAKPRDARRIGLIAAVALVAAAVLLGLMWINNPRYDGTSPEPVAERSP